MSCPRSASLFAMLPPMRPSPIIPSCITPRPRPRCGRSGARVPATPPNRPGPAHGVRAALVELARRMQVPRAEPMRHNQSRLADTGDQRFERGLAAGIDECLDRDVVPLTRLREQLLERAD